MAPLRPDSEFKQCTSRTHATRSHIHDMHTVKCMLEEGHDGMHAAPNGVGHVVYWTQGVNNFDYSTRFRFGKHLEISKS